MRPAAVMPLALALLCAAASPSFAATSAPAPREGSVDAGDGVKLFYRLVGHARDTVVVLHGGPGFSMSYLAADLEPLAAHHTLLFYDQRGGGRSTLVADSAALDIERFVDDLEAVRMRFGLRRLTLLAHSWGASVAALYAARFPERIGRLLIVDGIPPTRVLQREGLQRLDARRDSVTRQRLQEARAARLAHPGDAAACRAFFDLWIPAAYGDTATARRHPCDFCADSPEALANKLASVDRFTPASLGDWDWRPALHQVAAPALVIQGTKDYLPPASAREWAAALPNGRVLRIEGSGHFPYLESPAQFFAAADAFLRGKWPAGAETVSTVGTR